jgi:hypothetical protein
LGYEVEDLGAAVGRTRKIPNIGCDDRHVEGGFLMPLAAYVGLVDGG